MSSNFILIIGERVICCLKLVFHLSNFWTSQFIENAWQIQLFQIILKSSLFITYMKCFRKDHWENVLKWSVSDKCEKPQQDKPTLPEIIYRSVQHGWHNYLICIASPICCSLIVCLNSKTQGAMCCSESRHD